jgi:hypothetical protein
MPRKKSSQKLSGPKATSKTIRSYPLEIEEQGVDSKKTLEALESTKKQMLEMQNRIMAAPAMNGGFSTLMYKIEKIEQGQNQLVEKVDDIRIVLYDPDNGLYARIKNVENSKANDSDIKELEDSMSEIKHWKDTKEELCEEDSDDREELKKKILEQENTIKEIRGWHDKQAAITKWLAVTIGTVFISTIGKLIYDVVMEHVKLV